MLGSIATGQRVGVQSVFYQSNIQAVYDVWGSVQNRDLGSVAAAIQTIVKDVEPQLKPGNHVVIRGQIKSMQDAFGNLGMLPMAIGGPGEEQNAVLARAVIGGVMVGTITTLLFVPYLYSVIGRLEQREAGFSAKLKHQGSLS